MQEDKIAGVLGLILNPGDCLISVKLRSLPQWLKKKQDLLN